MRRTGKLRQTSTVWPAAIRGTRPPAEAPRRSTADHVEGAGASAMEAKHRSQRRERAMAKTAVGPSVTRACRRAHAAERRAGQIGGVEPADVARKTRQRQADHDAADDERQRDDRVGQADRLDRDDRRVHEERDAELREKAEKRSRSGTATTATRAGVRRAAGSGRPQVHHQGADCHAEHRDEIATNAKWYHIVTLKIRVSRIS